MRRRPADGLTASQRQAQRIGRAFTRALPRPAPPPPVAQLPLPIAPPETPQ